MEQIKLNAEELDLQIKEITHGMNGYPKDLGDIFITGFNNFENAIQFAKDNDAEVGLGKIRDGHHFYSYVGWRDKPLTAFDYLLDLGDNYSIVNIEDEKENFKETLIDLVENFEDDFDYLRDWIDDKEEIIEALNSAVDDEVVIVNGFIYFETVALTLMSYHEAVTTYSIGVYFKKN